MNKDEKTPDIRIKNHRDRCT